MLRTLERTGDTLGAPIVGRADGRRRRPQLAAPQPLFPRNETVEPPPDRDALEELNGIGHSDTRRDAHKKVTAIGWISWEITGYPASAQIASSIAPVFPSHPPVNTSHPSFGDQTR